MPACLRLSRQREAEVVRSVSARNANSWSSSSLMSTSPLEEAIRGHDTGGQRLRSGQLHMHNSNEQDRQTASKGQTTDRLSGVVGCSHLSSAAPRRLQEWG